LPRNLEKKRRKDERDAIRKEKLDLKKEEERKKLPLITLTKEGIPTELAYMGPRAPLGTLSPPTLHEELSGALSQRQSRRE
jgi:hypothetical protein